jgi:hypothetical protein
MAFCNADFQRRLPMAFPIIFANALLQWHFRAVLEQQNPMTKDVESASKGSDTYKTQAA